ncbi:MAG: DciA family protein [Bauldia sp.]
MAENGGSQRRRGAVKLAELVGKALDPVAAKRGFATADLLASWPDIVGRRNAEFTAPEKITWPRESGDGTGAGTLHMRVDGPRAVLIQHEIGQIIERLNSFFGYAAITRIRLVQAPVTRPSRSVETRSPAIEHEAEAALARTIAPVESDALRAALDRLGRGVLAKPLKDL